MYIFQNLATEILFKTLKFHQFEKKKRKEEVAIWKQIAQIKDPCLGHSWGRIQDQSITTLLYLYLHAITNT
jgi:hypothetical protein